MWSDWKTARQDYGTCIYCGHMIRRKDEFALEEILDGENRYRHQECWANADGAPPAAQCVIAEATPGRVRGSYVVHVPDCAPAYYRQRERARGAGEMAAWLLGVRFEDRLPQRDARL